MGTRDQGPVVWVSCAAVICVTAGPGGLPRTHLAEEQHATSIQPFPCAWKKPSAAQFLGNALQESPGAVWVSPPLLLLSLFSLANFSPAAGSGDVVPAFPGVQTSHPFWQRAQGTEQVLPGLN